MLTTMDREVEFSWICFTYRPVCGEVHVQAGVRRGLGNEFLEL